MRYFPALLVLVLLAASPTALAATKTFAIHTMGGNTDPHFVIAGATAKNPILNVDPGDSVTVTVTNKDNVSHDFEVQSITNSRVPTAASAFLTKTNDTGTVTFTIPDTKGKTYTYICNIHPTQMKGDLKVSGTAAAAKGTPGFEVVALLAAAGLAVALLARRKA